MDPPNRPLWQLGLIEQKYNLSRFKMSFSAVMTKTLRVTLICRCLVSLWQLIWPLSGPNPAFDGLQVMWQNLQLHSASDQWKYRQEVTRRKLVTRIRGIFRNLKISFNTFSRIGDFSPFVRLLKQHQTESKPPLKWENYCILFFYCSLFVLFYKLEECKKVAVIWNLICK